MVEKGERSVTRGGREAPIILTGGAVSPASAMTARRYNPSIFLNGLKR